LNDSSNEHGGDNKNVFSISFPHASCQPCYAMHLSDFSNSILPKTVQAQVAISYLYV